MFNEAYNNEGDINNINTDPPPSNDSLSGDGRSGLTGSPARSSLSVNTNNGNPNLGNNNTPVTEPRKSGKKRKRRASISSTEGDPTLSYKEDSPPLLQL